MSPSDGSAPLSRDHFVALHEFRCALRAYLFHSNERVARAGLTAQQYSLLAAVAAHPSGALSVGAAAEALFVNHNTAVELSQRAAAAGFLARSPDPASARRTLLSLTPEGAARLEAVTRLHIEELSPYREQLLASLARWNHALAAEPR